MKAFGLNKITTLSIALLLFSNDCLNAQQKWFSKFGWWGVDIGYDVIETYDGHYIVTGYTGSFTNGNSDVLLSKVHNTGWEMWTKHIGGINNDVGKAIVQTFDTAFVIAGYTNSYGNGGYDGYLIKLNRNGDTMWTKTFGGSDWDFFNDLRITSDSGFVMVGYTYSNSKGGKDMWIVKTDSLGHLQWEKRIGGINDDEGVSVEILQDKRIACFGTTYSFSDSKGNYCLFKTNNNGDSLFFKEWGYPNLTDIGYDFFERPTDNAFVICGTSQSNFGTDTTYYHQMVLDSLCNVLGDVKETGNKLKNQIVYTNAYFNTGKHYAVYDRSDYGQGKRDPNFYIFSGPWFITGTSYGSDEDDVIFSCKRTSDKGLIAVGYTKGFFGTFQEDVFIVKLDSTLFGAVKVVDVQDFNKTSVCKIYPTVTSDKIFIELTKNYSFSELFIQDTQGRTLFYQQALNTKETIDVSTFEEGIYFINIVLDEEKYTVKILRKN